MTAVNRGPTQNMTKGPLFLRYATVFITRTRKPQPRGILYILSIIKARVGVFYTSLFCLLFVGRLNSKHFRHLTQINNAHISSTIYGEPQQRKLSFSDRFSHAGLCWISSYSPIYG